MTSVHKRYDTRIFQKMCRSLAKNGYDVTLLVMDDLPEETKDGVRIVPVPFKPKNRLDRIFHSGRKLLKKAVELDCDLYHFHDPELLPIGLRLKKLGKTVIYDSHEDYPGQIREKKWIPSLFRPLVAWYVKQIENKVVHAIDAVICVTASSQQRFCERNYMAYKILNYPILQGFVQSRNSSETTLVYAGGVSRQWNHHKLIPLLVELPVQYDLSGPTNDGYLNELQALSGWEKVHYNGVIPFSEVIKHYARASIGVALLQYGCNTEWKKGTLGNTKIFEFMMAGLPVVATNFELWKPILERYHCGICVDVNNPDEIRDALRYLLNHPDEAKEMGCNGRRAVEQKFNWSVEEKKLLDLYGSVMQNRKKKLLSS